LENLILNTHYPALRGDSVKGDPNQKKHHCDVHRNGIFVYSANAASELARIIPSLRYGMIP
jgi:hypothetical protein